MLLDNLHGLHIEHHKIDCRISQSLHVVNEWYECRFHLQMQTEANRDRLIQEWETYGSLLEADYVNTDFIEWDWHDDEKYDISFSMRLTRKADVAMLKMAFG